MQNTTSFASDRPRDLVSIGRLAVDLYARQFGARLEDVSSFSKYLGGSSANVAFGTARLGVKSAMLSRVGDEQMGRFLLETLARVFECLERAGTTCARCSTSTTVRCCGV